MTSRCFSGKQIFVQEKKHMVDLLQAYSDWNTLGIPMDKNTTPHSLRLGSGSGVTSYA